MKIFAFCFFCQVSAVLFGQVQQPMWSMPLYFMDAVGNKDTLVVGYDTTANNDFNSNFGEVALTNPFHEIFEVRAAHKYPNSSTFSKTIIQRAVTSWGVPFWNMCPGSKGPYIYIHAIHQPVTVTWDPAFVSTEICRSATWITPDQGPETITPGNWLALWPQARYACLADSSSVVFDLTIGNGLDNIQMKRQVEVQGIGNKVIPVLQFYIDADTFSFSPCREGCCPVSTAEPQGSAQLVVSPNPATELFNLTANTQGDIISVEIYDIAGYKVQFQPIGDRKSNAFDISALKPGLYFVKCFYSSNKVGIAKFVKT